MKLFELRRTEDESGISGTGTVAQGIIFDNGTCVLTWLTEHTSVAVYASIETVVKVPCARSEPWYVEELEQESVVNFRSEDDWKNEEDPEFYPGDNCIALITK